MADYPSESEIEALIEQWEEENPRYDWYSSNVGDITTKRGFTTLCKTIVDNIMGAYNTTSGDVPMVLRQKGQYAALQAVQNLDNVDPVFFQQLNDIPPVQQTQFVDTWANVNCKVDIEDYKEQANYSELMDYEYEKAKMEYIFSVEGGLAEALDEEKGNTVGNLADCAQIYKDKADELQVGINDFWANEAVISMFKDGFDASDLRSNVVNPGVAPIPAPESDRIGFATGQIIASIYGDSLPFEYGFSSISWTDKEGAVAREVQAANFNNSELLMAFMDPVQERLLKYPERIQSDINGNFTDPDGNPLGDKDLKEFPFYWAGMVINFVRVAQFIVSKAPTPEELKSLKSGDDEQDAFTTISNKNHGEGIRGIYNRSYRNSPLGVFNSSIPYLLPRNSLVVENMNREDGDRLLNATTNRISTTLESLHTNAQNALDKLSSFYSASTDAGHIKTKLDQLYEILQEIHGASECIKNQALENERASERAKNALEELEDTGLFKDRSRNAAIAALKAAIDDTAPGALITGGAERTLFREQCFLLSFVAKIAEHKKVYLDYVDSNGIPKSGTVHKKLPYTVTGYPLSSGVVPETPGQYNACLQVNGDAYGFINRLVMNQDYAAFFEMDTWMLSSMQPKIRLFKVEYNEEGEETEVEMRFNSAFSKDEMDLFMDSNARGVGVGLKSFTFTYDGNNPFAAKKSIKANLKIFANSFNELFKERVGTTTAVHKHDGTVTIGEPKEYKYVDLALKTFSKVKNPDAKQTDWQKIVSENSNKAKLNFRLKAVVGWSEPKLGTIGQPSDPKYDNDAMRKAAKQSYVTLNLTPTVHNFDFDEQGRVVMDINYLAYVEDFFDDRAFNVFADPSGITGMERVKRELKTKKFTKECSESHTEELDAIKREYANIAGKEKRTAVQGIINSLIEQNRVHYISIPLENVRRFTSLGPFATYDELAVDDQAGIGTSYTPDIRSSIEYARNAGQKVKEAIAAAERARTASDQGAFTNEERNILRSSLIAVDPNQHYLTFFYLSDLVDVVLANIEKEINYLKAEMASEFRKPDMARKFDQEDFNEKLADINKYAKNFRRLRILLGPVELARPVGDKLPYETTFVNFGDLPISVRYFAEFLASKTLKNDETVYSLPRFLNDLMNNLINNFLNSKTCFNFDISQRVRVNQNVLTSYSYQQRGGRTKDEITFLLEKKARDMKGSGKAGVPTRLFLNDKILGNVGERQVPIINVSGDPRGESTYAPLSHEINYFVFFAARTRPADRMTGDIDQDLQGGIFHYLLGKDRGIVKNIKLQKTQTPGLQEVRFEQEGYDGLEQLRVAYDVEIDCYANVNAFPGTYIYIPPQGFDPATIVTDFDMTKFGIGGYYMIYRSSHNFASGEASTKIYAKWVAQIESEANQAQQDQASSLTQVSKCSLPRRDSANSQ